MAKFELKLPKMGESVAEATLTAWLKDIGDKIDADEAVLEIATDKVDSEVPSEVDGVLIQKLFEVDDLIEVGHTIAIIDTEADTAVATTHAPEVVQVLKPSEVEQLETSIAKIQEEVNVVSSKDNRFYSPLVRNIAKKEGITQAQLDSIQGTGKDARVTKKDILAYLAHNSVTSPEKLPVKESVVELIQSKLTVENLRKNLAHILKDENIKEIQYDYKKLKSILSTRQKVSKAIAKEILSIKNT